MFYWFNNDHQTYPCDILFCSVWSLTHFTSLRTLVSNLLISLKQGLKWILSYDMKKSTAMLSVSQSKDTIGMSLLLFHLCSFNSRTCGSFENMICPIRINIPLYMYVLCKAKPCLYDVTEIKHPHSIYEHHFDHMAIVNWCFKSLGLAHVAIRLLSA